MMILLDLQQERLGMFVTLLTDTRRGAKYLRGTTIVTADELSRVTPKQKHFARVAVSFWKQWPFIASCKVAVTEADCNSRPLCCSSQVPVPCDCSIR